MTATIRLMLNIATTKVWKIKQLDVSSSFLHSELQELVYMYQPARFFYQERPHHVCRLTKAMYGLKQAPKAWFDSKSDPSLFTNNIDNKIMVFLLYVDYILLPGSEWISFKL